MVDFISVVEHATVGALFAAVPMAIGYATGNLDGTTLTVAGAAFMLGFQGNYNLKQVILEMQSEAQDSSDSAEASSSAENEPITVKAPVALNVAPASTSSGNITYTIAGQTITVTPNSPIGSTQIINGVTYTVGQAIAQSTLLPSGDLVPAGAVFVGAGQFELNGNYYS